MAAPLADPAVRRVAYLRARVGLGDLLCTMPALRALRAARPDVRLTVITWPETAPVVARFRDCVDELLPFPGHPGIPERQPRPELVGAFLYAAGARRFDLLIQGYGDRPAAHAACGLIPAAARGGFAARGFDAADTALYLPYPHHLHEIRRHQRLVAHLGGPLGTDRTPYFPLRDADRARCADLMGRHGLAPGRYVVVHPGATSPSRRWPADRFAAVADGLAALGLRVVVTGLRGEERVTSAVVRHARSPVVDLTGLTPLGAFACLLSDAALLVSNDTGGAHLAAATATPSVTVFLSGDPVRWAYPLPRHRAVRAGVACSPCPHLTCPIDFRCAHGVAPDDVLDAARSLLE